jgi:hypothetical protein
MSEQPDIRTALEEQLTTRAGLLAALKDLRADIEGVVREAGERRAVQPGAFEELSLKDVVAHLNGWRQLSAARLEAALAHGEPAMPWPGALDEDHDLDAINRWFYETNRDKSLAEIMNDSRDTFERCERAIIALPEADLFTAGRFPWLGEYVLGPAVVSGTLQHFHEDHEAEIRAWLARD